MIYGLKIEGKKYGNLMFILSILFVSSSKNEMINFIDDQKHPKKVVLSYMIFDI